MTNENQVLSVKAMLWDVPLLGCPPPKSETEHISGKGRRSAMIPLHIGA